MNASFLYIMLMMKKLLSVLCLLLMLTACSKKPYTSVKTNSIVWYEYFDTVCQIVAYDNDDSQKFDSLMAEAEKLTEYYYRLFDIYHSYQGLNNLYTINKAKGEAVEVDREMIDFLKYCEDVSELVGDKFNVMLGPVLKIWHDFREAVENEEDYHIPDYESLSAAYEHCQMESLVIDEENQTVRLSDSAASLDVGGIAKGYAAQKVADYLASADPEGTYLLSFGGNVICINDKRDGTAWKIALTDPDNTNETFIKVNPQSKSVVTSGNYQRYVEVDGVRYHHVIDTTTLFPSTYWSSVSVIGEDSGLCDALSTTLFTMSLEEGKKLLSAIAGYEALWLDNGHNLYCTDGFKEYIINE